MSNSLTAQRDAARRTGQPFDVLVIGGGSNGAAAARDAAMRGLKVALLEKEDFGYGTVSRSTRLIHGGLRYLELFEFGLVRESLREREILLRTAPHLVHPLAFFTPVYRHSPVGVLKLRLGMWLYDLLSWDKSMDRHTFLPREAAAAAEPLLNDEGLLGAFIYYDGHVPMPERLCLEAAMQAADRGALVLNYARAVRVTTAGGLYSVAVQDELTGHSWELRARTVVNATGPWADAVNESLLGPDKTRLLDQERSEGPRAEVVGSARPTDRLRRTKGIHLLVPKLSERGVVMLAEADGRLFFAIPWGEFTYIGTTDTDFDGDLDRVRAEPDEIRYLLQETRRVFPEADLDRVHLTTAGVRPLVKDPKARKEGQVSRKHLIHHHKEEGFPGYFSVLGGKITNMRSVAEEAVDDVIRHLNVNAGPCTTRQALFPGAMHPDLNVLRGELISRAAGKGIEAATVHNLVDLYGSNADAVLDLALQDEELAKPLSPDGPDIWAQLEYSLRREWVATTADFVLRRSALGYSPGMGAHVAPEVARRIAAAWDRDDAARAADLAAYEEAVERMSGNVEQDAARA